ncbi:hypothetical protein SDC9_130040 [bioreactor metagenome]|uniref:Uncharacterized protein n=1 Tax=bioreactor metagenome TaxID=1076179 RepID=A0A645D1A5_9ZZZZ
MLLSTSDGVAQPGITGTPFCTHQRTVSKFVPGLITALAPASTASRACCGVSTVPAQTNSSGQFFAIARMESAAAALRNVISAAGRPPLANALANGTAWAASSILMTGTMPT